MPCPCGADSAAFIRLRMVRTADSAASNSSGDNFSKSRAIQSSMKELNSIMPNPPQSRATPVGMQVMTLYNAKAQYQGILDPVRDHLWKSQTKIGKASQAAKTPEK